MTNGLIIMLCRNALRYSQACLKTLLKQTGKIDILVVDNASTDGTAKYMASQQAQHSNIYRMTYQQVTSVARAWNEALQWGWERGHREALVVNSDTELLPETYVRLHGYLYGHSNGTRLGMVTGVSVHKDPSYPEGEIAARPHPDYSCFMITREAHRYVPFDGFFKGAYFEDIDHHIRLCRAGIYACSINLSFLHQRSATLRTASPEEQERINANHAANQTRFREKWGCLPGSKDYETLFTVSAPRPPAARIS